MRFAPERPNGNSSGAAACTSLARAPGSTGRKYEESVLCDAARGMGVTNKKSMWMGVSQTAVPSAGLPLPEPHLLHAVLEPTQR